MSDEEATDDGGLPRKALYALYGVFAVILIVVLVIVGVYV